ncbi:hypothetical protein [Synechococcus sp. UW179A]|uniref:hypothetical protein n=1 Tax=Synechococcus sp. UW179A TaxID=2575510 RepID=UPI00352CBEC8
MDRRRGNLPSVWFTNVPCHLEGRCAGCMGWLLRWFPLTKPVPLAISRGTTSVVERLELCLDHDGITGRGESGGVWTPVTALMDCRASRLNSRVCCPPSTGGF